MIEEISIDGWQDVGFAGLGRACWEPCLTAGAQTGESRPQAAQAPGGDARQSTQHGARRRGAGAERGAAEQGGRAADSAGDELGDEARLDGGRADDPLHGDGGKPADAGREGQGRTAASSTWRIRQDGADARTRPVTFFYNGGPGSASIWLHMGSLGPVRVITESPEATGPAPFEWVQNQYSLLDKTRPGVYRCAAVRVFARGGEGNGEGLCRDATRICGRLRSSSCGTSR